MTVARTRGFTLIELMVTLVILSILVSIAYPSYERWMVQTRRSDAQTILTQLANQEEKFFTQCNTYTAVLSSGSVGACSGLGYTEPNAPSPQQAYSPEQNYLVSLLAANASCALTGCYVIQADPNGAGTTGRQRNDGIFEISSTGQKLWDAKNDGSFSSSW